MNPWLAGHLFWPLTERLVGRDTMRRFDDLCRSERWSTERRRDLQARKLRRILRSAAQHCPFYARRFRDAGLDPADPHLGPDDLRCLPVLARAEIREHLHEMTWSGCPGGPLLYNTGGSSGEPLRFHVDRFRNAADTAARLRARSWWGVAPGDREILLWGAPTELKTNDRVRRCRDALLNQSILNAFDMTAETMSAYLTTIRDRRPVCIYGYASSLALLARHAQENGQPLTSSGLARPRAVFATGEVLLDQDRQAIESVFGAPVAVEYGSRDGGFTAMSCRAGHLHAADENLIVELLDDNGQPVAAGEAGRITLTHLEALAMPLIRYAIGDLARQPPKTALPCRCGRNLTSLAEIRGRLTDQIVCREHGQLKHMHALSLIYVLREAEGLAQFRVLQPSIDRLEIEVVADHRFTSLVERDVEQSLRRRMGEGVTIIIQRRDRIPPTASGKHACVVSQVR
ncbi:MAG TPA: phenylacetate--CoA ligase family protein [Phycisphaerae bacterium]|nr:phenylacetate--CoA ligase family protein [Phycisphaerae bacterium]HRY67912.1 phenylacetate--CoA ligase family protein [Phycisphaerae bacterium]HSA26071.1 phenylacetate--CoA ligase family protein [Phycisphaerae bacterium]